MNPSSRQGSPAFTLIETALALAILAAAIFALMHATTVCLAVIRVSRHYNTARAVMEQGSLEHPLVWTNAPADNEVAPEEYEGGYVFSRAVEQSDAEEDLYIISTRVTWTERGETGFEESVTYGYFPQEETGL